MNWIIRFGQWWEKTKSPILRQSDRAEFVQWATTNWNECVNRLEHLEQAKQMPEVVIKALAEVDRDLKVINNRLNKIESYIGFHRDPKPELVPDAARIS